MLLTDFKSPKKVNYCDVSAAGVKPSLTWQDDRVAKTLSNKWAAWESMWLLFTRPGWLVIGWCEPKTDQTGQSQLFHSGADQSKLTEHVIAVFLDFRRNCWEEQDARINKRRRESVILLSFSSFGLFNYDLVHLCCPPLLPFSFYSLCKLVEAL